MIRRGTATKFPARREAGNDDRNVLSTGDREGEIAMSWLAAPGGICRPPDMSWRFGRFQWNGGLSQRCIY